MALQARGAKIILPTLNTLFGIFVLRGFLVCHWTFCIFVPFVAVCLQLILWRLLAQITTNYYSVQLFLSLLCFYLIVANVNVKGDKC